MISGDPITSCFLRGLRCARWWAIAEPSEISQELPYWAHLTQAGAKTSSKATPSSCDGGDSLTALLIEFAGCSPMLKHTFMILYGRICGHFEVWLMYGVSVSFECYDMLWLMTQYCLEDHQNISERRKSFQSGPLEALVGDVTEIPLALCWSMFACCPGGRSGMVFWSSKLGKVEAKIRWSRMNRSNYPLVI